MSNIVVKTEVQKIVVKNADGRDGKSAFQQAVEGGYTGTEQEFNCSLSLLADVAEVKKQISDAINFKGGEANANESFTELAEDIKNIPNFNTNGCEYISEVYRPTTLLDAYYNRTYLKSVVDNYVEEILGSYTFTYCTFLQSVQMQNLETINGGSTFYLCASLQSVQMQNLATINGSSTFNICKSLQSVQMQNLVTINGNDTFASCKSLKIIELPSLATINGESPFNSCDLLEIVELPKLTTYVSNFFRHSQPFSITLGVLINVSTIQYTNLTRTINITIGQGTDVNLPFNFWTAANVIAEGQAGIDEINDNLYNNLLTKLYDHSQDGQTRTLRLGWLAKVTQENIDYANSKGWTLTT